MKLSQEVVKMAFSKPKKKDYKLCEFCKIKPCMHVLKNEVEYGNFCRNYQADARKIANDKLQRKPYSIIPN